MIIGMLPIVALVGRPSAAIIANYLKTWRPESYVIEEERHAPSTFFEECGDVAELLDPPIILTACASASVVDALAKMPNGMVLLTEARLGPAGLVAGIRQCFLTGGAIDYTADHLAAANALVIEAHIRRCRKLANKD